MKKHTHKLTCFAKGKRSKCGHTSVRTFHNIRSGGYCNSQHSLKYNYSAVRDVFRISVSASWKRCFLFSFLLSHICADLSGTAPAPLVPASPISGYTQGSFRIVAPPPEVHRKRRQIVGGLPSEGDTTLLLSHFHCCSVEPVLIQHKQDTTYYAPY